MQENLSQFAATRSKSCTTQGNNDENMESQSMFNINRNTAINVAYLYYLTTIA